MQQGHDLMRLVDGRVPHRGPILREGVGGQNCQYIQIADKTDFRTSLRYGVGQIFAPPLRVTAHFPAARRKFWTPRGLTRKSGHLGCDFIRCETPCCAARDASRRGVNGAPPAALAAIVGRSVGSRSDGRSGPRCQPVTAVNGQLSQRLQCLLSYATRSTESKLSPGPPGGSTQRLTRCTPHSASPARRASPHANARVPHALYADCATRAHPVSLLMRPCPQATY